MQGSYQYWDDSVSSLFVLLETTVKEERQFSQCVFMMEKLHKIRNFGWQKGAA